MIDHFEEEPLSIFGPGHGHQVHDDIISQGREMDQWDPVDECHLLVHRADHPNPSLLFTWVPPDIRLERTVGLMVNFIVLYKGR